jgi:hypothetical protein
MAATGALAAMPATADLDDSAYTLGLCSRHTGRGPADAVLARFATLNRQSRDARSKTVEAFEQIYRRGQGDGGRVSMEGSTCQRMTKAILKKFGAG